MFGRISQPPWSQVVKQDKTRLVYVDIRRPFNLGRANVDSSSSVMGKELLATTWFVIRYDRLIAIGLDGSLHVLVVTSASSREAESSMVSYTLSSRS